MNWYVRSGLVLLSVASMAMLGCGSATNNDQGVSFTMLGYSVAATASATPGAGGTTSGCSTNPNLSGGVFALGSQTETSGATQQVLAGVVVRNNLTAQFIRTQSIQFEYIIPGSQIQPPTTAVPYGGVVAQAAAGANGAAGAPGLLCATVTVVPPQIISWMSLNRASIPEPPFMLIARGQVTGTSSAGDVFTTNPVDIAFTVVTDNPIIPADDSVDGTGDATGALEGDFIDDSGDSTDTPTVDNGSDAQI